MNLKRLNKKVQFAGSQLGVQSHYQRAKLNLWSSISPSPTNDVATVHVTGNSENGFNSNNNNMIGYRNDNTREISRGENDGEDDAKARTTYMYFHPVLFGILLVFFVMNVVLFCRLTSRARELKRRESEVQANSSSSTGRTLSATPSAYNGSTHVPVGGMIPTVTLYERNDAILGNGLKRGSLPAAAGAASGREGSCGSSSHDGVAGDGGGRTADCSTLRSATNILGRRGPADTMFSDSGDLSGRRRRRRRSLSDTIIEMVPLHDYERITLRRVGDRTPEGAVTNVDAVAVGGSGGVGGTERNLSLGYGKDAFIQEQ